MNALDAARLGLGSVEHWYGIPEALFEDRTVQDLPLDYNEANEQDRFRESGRLWKQAAKPGSEKWNAVLTEMIRLGFVVDPTMNVYEGGADFARARSAEWHETYTHPNLWRYFSPNRENHASYHYSWTTTDEIEWRRNYQIWLKFVNDYKNRGGRIVTGSDVGNIYALYGFGYIREFELLQEAGFHPIEVIRSATLWGAELLNKPKGKPAEVGIIRPGKLADLVLVEENPLQNFKVLYGTGAIRLNDRTRQVERVGGVRYTIKDGIVYDAKQLLADVAKMVEAAKKKAATTDSPDGRAR
jgi:hypothetical protein